MTALFGLAPFGTGVVPCDGARFRWLHDTMLCRTRLCWVCLHWHWLRRHLPLMPLRYSMCRSCRLVLLLNRLRRRSRWRSHHSPLLSSWLLRHAVHPILHVLPLEPRLWRRLSARLYHSMFKGHTWVHLFGVRLNLHRCHLRWRWSSWWRTRSWRWSSKLHTLAFWQGDF